jgi:hypothetical protein
VAVAVEIMVPPEVVRWVLYAPVLVVQEVLVVTPVRTVAVAAVEPVDIMGPVGPVVLTRLVLLAPVVVEVEVEVYKVQQYHLDLREVVVLDYMVLEVMVSLVVTLFPMLHAEVV